MARQNQQRNNMLNDKIEEAKSPSIFQKIFFWVIIPLMFVITILLVIATFTNTNVFEKANELSKNLPFVPKTEEVPNDLNTYNQRIVELQAEIQEKEAEIEQLQSKLDKEITKNQEAVILQEQLEYEIERLKREQNKSQQAFSEIVSVYEKMSAKQAAPILVEMDQKEAIEILSNLKPEKVSEILSKMSPTDAAKFTELLAK